MKLPIEMEIRAYRNPAQAFAIELYGFNKDHNHVAQTIAMKEHVTGMRMDPFIQLNELEAQLLANSLYDAGIRPSQMAPKDEESIKYHLEDMRKITFHYLGLQRLP